MKQLLLLLLLAIFASVAAATDGKATYEASCVACHGADGKGAFPGVPDLAPRLAKTDAELIRNILNGFQSNGSAMAMPPKGGNPGLTAEDAAALVTYLRGRRGASPPSRPGAGAAAATPVKAALATSQRGAASASDPGAFARGAKAWGERCASCHAMRDPKDFNDAKWKVITTHMRIRAGLDGADVRDINAFLTGSN